jgi:hypothetical protein
MSDAPVLPDESGETVQLLLKNRGEQPAIREQTEERAVSFESVEFSDDKRDGQFVFLGQGFNGDRDIGMGQQAGQHGARESVALSLQLATRVAFFSDGHLLLPRFKLLQLFRLSLLLRQRRGQRGHPLFFTPRHRFFQFLTVLFPASGLFLFHRFHKHAPSRPLFQLFPLLGAHRFQPLPQTILPGPVLRFLSALTALTLSVRRRRMAPRR